MLNSNKIIKFSKVCSPFNPKNEEWEKNASLCTHFLLKVKSWKGQIKFPDFSNLIGIYSILVSPLIFMIYLGGQIHRVTIQYNTIQYNTTFEAKTQVKLEHISHSTLLN